MVDITHKIVTVKKVKASSGYSNQFKDKTVVLNKVR